MTIDLIKELRARTNVSLNECRTALYESKGSLDGALLVLQKRGLAKAGQITNRVTSEGRVFSYVHNGKIAVMVELNCETDFAAKTPLFIEFGENIAMHVAAFNPTYLRVEDIPTEVRSTQMIIFAASCKAAGMPDERLNQIAEGKFVKWCSEVCLMGQFWIHDNKKTVEDARATLVAALGENISIRRIVRWEMGT